MSIPQYAQPMPALTDEEMSKLREFRAEMAKRGETFSPLKNFQIGDTLPDIPSNTRHEVRVAFREDEDGLTVDRAAISFPDSQCIAPILITDLFRELTELAPEVTPHTGEETVIPRFQALGAALYSIGGEELLQQAADLCTPTHSLRSDVICMWHDLLSEEIQRSL